MMSRSQHQAIIEVWMMPPRECSPNGGSSLKARMRAKREFREEAGKAVVAALSNDSGPLRAFVGNLAPMILDAEIAWCCGRKRLDDDNAKAILKSAIDGLSDGLWGGRDRHVRIGEVTQVRGEGMVTFTLREAA